MLQKIKTTILIDQQNTSSIIHSLLRRESINLKYVMINLFRKKVRICIFTAETCKTQNAQKNFLLFISWQMSKTEENKFSSCCLLPKKIVSFFDFMLDDKNSARPAELCPWCADYSYKQYIKLLDIITLKIISN